MQALVAATLVVAAGACSAGEEAGPPPATPDEKRALAEAEAMIPRDELPAATATPPASESPADGQ